MKSGDAPLTDADEKMDDNASNRDKNLASKLRRVAAKTKEKVTDKLREAELISQDANASTVRVISLSVAGGGTAGISIACAVMLVYSDIHAVLDGSVTKADNVQVKGVMNFGEVQAAVIGIAISGTAGVAASVGYVNFAGQVTTGIGAHSTIGSEEESVKHVEVITDADTLAGCAAASLAGGLGAVSAGVALVFNRTVANTYIARGAQLFIKNGDLDVLADVDATAKAFIISVSLGEIAIGATVAVVVNNVQAMTFVGSVPYITNNGGVGTVKSDVLGTIVADDISIKNNIHGISTVLGVGVAGGLVAVNGIVAMNFNRVVSVALLDGFNISNGGTTKTNKVLVDSKINGDAGVTITSLVVGGVAAGACVGISQIGAISANVVGVDGKMYINKLVVGESASSSEAFVNILSGKAGGASVAINIAVALNESHFLSDLRGTTSGLLDANEVSIVMNGNAMARSIIASASVGFSFTVCCSVPIAVTKGIQEALVSSNAEMIIRKLTVKSTQNTSVPVKTLEVQYGLKKSDTTTIKFTDMAQTFLVSMQAGPVTVGVSATTAIANATCRAKVAASNLTIVKEGSYAGGIEVAAVANTKAVAQVFEYGISAVGVGTIAAYTYAKGTIESILEVLNNGVINAAGDVKVSVDYNAESIIKLAPSSGGGLVSAHVNAAISKVKSVANAVIIGSGTINADGYTVSVVSNGKVRAVSEIESKLISAGAVSVNASFVMAVLAANQISSADGVAINAKKVRILSFYNVNNNSESADVTTPSANNNYGAFALVGAPLVSVSGFKLAANIGLAYSSSVVRAVLYGASPKTSEDIYINTFANSYADTQVCQPTVSVSAVNAGVTYVKAFARGTYEAGVNSTNSNSNIEARNIYIGSGYRTKAYSVTGPIGGGVSLSVASVSVNIARAYTQSAANSYLINAGSGNIKGNVVVKTVGDSVALADVLKYTVSISLVDAAANHLLTYSMASQQAFTNFGKDMVIGGNLDVTSTLDGQSYAKVGNSEGVSLSLVEGSVNIAKAFTATYNNAYIAGYNGAVVKALKAKVLAKSNTSANAIALKPVSVSVASVCGSYALSDCYDQVYAHVGNGNAFTLDLNGSADVKAQSKTTSYTECASGVSVSLVSGSGNDVIAFIGDAAAQTVKAYVAANAKLIANGDISIVAENVGTIEAKLTAGFKISGISISSNNVTTVSTYRTDAYVAANAYVESKNGSVTIKAINTANANSLVNGDGCGILVSADFKAALNYITQNCEVYVDKNAVVKAHDNINISTDVNANASAHTNANSGGIFSGGSLTATQTIGRNVNLKINNATVNARFGNLNIILEIGRKDRIYTAADGSSVGLVGIGGAHAKTELVNSGKLSVEGSQLNADFGTLNLMTNVSESGSYVNGDFSAGGLGGSPTANVYDNVAVLSGVVTVSGSKVRATNVNIASQIKELYLYANAYSKLVAAGGAGFAQARFNLAFINQVNIVNKSEVTAYNNASILTSSTPSKGGTNIETKAKAVMVSLAGYIESTAAVDGTVNSTSLISNSTVRGYNVSLNSTAFNGGVSQSSKGTKVSIFAVKDVNTRYGVVNGNTVNADSGSVFEIGGAAVGAKVGIDENGKIYQTGLLGKISSSVSADKVVLNGKMIPRGTGTLSAAGVDLSKAVVNYYDGSKLEIDTYFPGTTVLCAIDMNTANGEPKMYAAKFGKVNKISPELPSSIKIDSYNGGDLLFGNVVANEHGSTNINWINGAGNLLASYITVEGNKITPLWTVKLNITNAKNIGTSTNEYYSEDEYSIALGKMAEQKNNTYFQVFMCKHNNVNPGITATASGDVFFEPILVEVNRMYTLTAASSNKAVDGRIILGDISTDGVLDIHMSDPRRINYTPEAGGVCVATPETGLVYVDGTGNDSVALKGAALERYFKEVDDDGNKMYVLPDNSILILDENDKVVSFNGYELYQRMLFGEETTNRVILATDVVDGYTYYASFDYTLGKLEVEEGFSSDFTVYLTAEQIKLLKTKGLSDGTNVNHIYDYVNYVVEVCKNGTWGTLEYASELDRQNENDCEIILSILMNGTAKYNLKNGGFGNYYNNTEELPDLSLLDSKVKFYKLTVNYNSDKHYTQNVILMAYNDIEYLGLYSVHYYYDDDDEEWYISADVASAGTRKTDYILTNGSTSDEESVGHSYTKVGPSQHKNQDIEGSGSTSYYALTVIKSVMQDVDNDKKYVDTPVYRIANCDVTEYGDYRVFYEYAKDAEGNDTTTIIGGLVTLNTLSNEITYYVGSVVVSTEEEDVTINEEIENHYYYFEDEEETVKKYIDLPEGIVDDTDDESGLVAEKVVVGQKDHSVIIESTKTSYYYINADGEEVEIKLPTDAVYDSLKKAYSGTVTISPVKLEIVRKEADTYYYMDGDDKVAIDLPANAQSIGEGQYSATITVEQEVDVTIYEVEGKFYYKEGTKLVELDELPEDAVEGSEENTYTIKQTQNVDVNITISKDADAYYKLGEDGVSHVTVDSLDGYTEDTENGYWTKTTKLADEDVTVDVFVKETGRFKFADPRDGHEGTTNYLDELPEGAVYVVEEDGCYYIATVTLDLEKDIYKEVIKKYDYTTEDGNIHYIEELPEDAEKVEGEDHKYSASVTVKETSVKIRIDVTDAGDYYANITKLAELPDEAVDNGDGTYSLDVTIKGKDQTVTVYNNETYGYFYFNQYGDDVFAIAELPDDAQDAVASKRVSRVIYLPAINNIYNVTETVAVGKDGKVYTKLNGLQYIETVDGDITTNYGANGSSTVSGDGTTVTLTDRPLKLEKVLDEIAKDAAGNYYYLTTNNYVNTWNLATKQVSGTSTLINNAEGTTLYEITANGCRLYENGVAKYNYENEEISPVEAVGTTFSMAKVKSTEESQNRYDINKLESKKAEVFFWYDGGYYELSDANDTNGITDNIISLHNVYDTLTASKDDKNNTVLETILNKYGAGATDGIEYKFTSGTGNLVNRNTVNDDTSYYSGSQSIEVKDTNMQFEKNIVILEGGSFDIIALNGSVTGLNVTLQADAKFRVLALGTGDGQGLITFDDIIVNGKPVSGSAEPGSYLEFTSDGQITVKTLQIVNQGEANILSYHGGFNVINTDPDKPSIEVGNGSTLIINVEDDITMDSLSIHNDTGNIVKLYSTNGNVIIPDVSITLGAEATGKGNDVVVDAMGNIAIDKLFMSNTSNPTLKLENKLVMKTHAKVDGDATIRGKLLSYDWIITNSIVDANIAGDIVIDNAKNVDYADYDPEVRFNTPLIVNKGSVVNLTSNDGGFLSSGLDTKVKEIKLRTIDVSDSTLKIVASKNIEISLVNVEHSDITLDSLDGSLLFDKVNVSGISNVTLAANNNIDLLHQTDVEGKEQHAAITYDETTYDKKNAKTSTLTLTAGRNIGNTAKWMYIDVPDTVKPVVTLVNSFYIDAQKQIPWDIYQYFNTNGVGIEGINLALNNKTALNFLGYSDVQYFISLFDLDTNEKLAQWMIDHLGDNAADTATKKNFYNYVKDYEDLITLTNNNKALEAENVADLLKASSVLNSSALAKAIKAAYQAAYDEQYAQYELDKAEFEANPLNEGLVFGDFMFDEAGEYRKAFKAGIESTELTNSDKLAIVTYLLYVNDEYVANNDSSYIFGERDKTELVNELFYNGANLDKEYADILSAALRATYSSKSEVKAELDKANKDLTAAQTAYQKAYGTQLTELDNLNNTVNKMIAAAKFADEAVLAEFKAEAYKTVNAKVAKFADELSLLTTDDDKKALVNTYAEELMNELNQLATNSGVDFSTKISNTKSIFNLKVSYENKVSEAEATYLTIAQVEARIQLLTQRYKELCDSFADEDQAREIVDRVKEIVVGDPDQGEDSAYTKAIKALEAAEKTLAAKQGAYETFSLDKTLTADYLKLAREDMMLAVADVIAARNALADLRNELYSLINTHVVANGRDFEMVIGEMYGSAHIYNTGDITITVDPNAADTELRPMILARAAAGKVAINHNKDGKRISDIILTNVRSEYGDVTIKNLGGSIYAADLDEVTNEDFAKQEWIYRNDGLDYENAYVNGAWTNPVELDSLFAQNFFLNLGPRVGLCDQDSVKNFEKLHIIGGNLTLYAAGSIGSRFSPLLTETRSYTYEKVVNVTGNNDPYGFGTYNRGDLIDQFYGQKYLEYFADKQAAYDVYYNEFYYPTSKEYVHGYKVIGASNLITLLEENVGTFADDNNVVPAGYRYIAEMVDADGVKSTYGIELAVEYYWLRIYDYSKPMTVNAVAMGGDLYMVETTGSVNIGEIHAENDLSYIIPEDINDGRTEQQKADNTPNIYAKGNATFTTGEDDVNPVFGTKENPLLVSVGTIDEDGKLVGGLTLRTTDKDVNLKVKDILVLNATCADSHYEIDVISDYGSVVLNDMNPDTKVLSGHIYAKGSVSINTVGDIGTKAKPFEITDKVTYYYEGEKQVGKVDFNGKNVYLNILEDSANDAEVSGSAILGRSVADGELVLNAAGYLVDGNDNSLSALLIELADRQYAYNEAKNELESALAYKASLDNNHSAQKVKDLEQAIIDKNDEATAKNDEIGSLCGELDALLLDLEAKQTDLDNYNKIDLVALKNDPNATKDDIHKALAELVAKEKALADATSLVNAKREEIRVANAEYSAINDEIEALTKEYEDAVAYNTNVPDYITRKTTERNAYKDRIKELDALLLTETDPVAIQAIKDERSQLRDNVLALDKDIRKAIRALDELTKVNGTIDEATAALNERADELDALKKMVEAQMALDEAIHRNEAEGSDLSANNELAKRYIYAATNAMVQAVDANKDSTVIATIQKAIDEALLVDKLVSDAERLTVTDLNNLTADDIALLEVLGLTVESSKEDIIKAVVDYQNTILGITDAIDEFEELGSGNESQAQITVDTYKQLIKSYDEIVALQRIVDEKTVAYKNAEEAYNKAKLAFDTIVAKLGVKHQSLVNGEQYNEILNKLMKDSEFMKLYRAYVNAENAMADAKDELDAANNDLNTKAQQISQLRDIVDQEEVTNELIHIDNKINSNNDEISDLTRLASGTTPAGDWAKARSALNAQKTVVYNAEKELEKQVNRLKDLVKDAVDYEYLIGQSLTENTVATDIRPDDVDYSKLPLDTRKEVEDQISLIRETQNNLAKEYEKEQDLQEEFDVLNDRVYSLIRENEELQEEFNSISAENGISGTSNKDIIRNSAANQLNVDDTTITVEKGDTSDEAKIGRSLDDAQDATLTVNGNAVIRTGGGFGDAGEDVDGVKSQMITTDIKGTLDLVANGGVDIASEDSLRLVQVVAEDDVRLETLGNITSAAAKSPVIKGNDFEAVAITGSEEESDGTHSVGTENKPLNVDVKGIKGTADDIALNNSNKENTELGDITANNNVYLNLNGSATPEDDDSIINADKVTLKAKGDIGVVTEETKDQFNENVEQSNEDGRVKKLPGSINLITDELDMSGDNINISNSSEELKIDNLEGKQIFITDEGNLRTGDDGIIKGEEIYINSNGNIGTPVEELRIRGAKEVVTNTIYGHLNYRILKNKASVASEPIRYRLRTRWDEVTDLGGVVGFLPRSAKFEFSALDLDPEVEGYDLLKKAADSEYFLAGMNVEAKYNTYGIIVIVRLPEDCELENGTTVYALTSIKGHVYVAEGIVRDGNAIFNSRGLKKDTAVSYVVITEEGLEGLDILNTLGITEKGIIRQYFSKLVLKYIDEHIPERMEKEEEPKQEEVVEDVEEVVDEIAAESPNYLPVVVGVGLAAAAIYFFLVKKKKKNDE